MIDLFTLDMKKGITTSNTRIQSPYASSNGNVNRDFQKGLSTEQSPKYGAKRY